VRLEGSGQFKKIHLIGTRSRDLPACSIVPQPTTLPRATLPGGTVVGFETEKTELTQRKLSTCGTYCDIFSRRAKKSCCPQSLPKRTAGCGDTAWGFLFRTDTADNRPKWSPPLTAWRPGVVPPPRVQISQDCNNHPARQIDWDVRFGVFTPAFRTMP
jgi:hypothetical protein